MNAVFKPGLGWKIANLATRREKRDLNPCPSLSTNFTLQIYPQTHRARAEDIILLSFIHLVRSQCLQEERHHHMKEFKHYSSYTSKVERGTGLWGNLLVR
ncbi:hypothetical protein AMELA_G00281730 [Ameiurus melas]|uniref:Uncharacterized protein n=1 Tax=Ameiurus melas TaxID=219545 RepID=A0A7J5ZL13_AMEME|nr:hypothetical protein AMELA_G00281730 [Ameiurus melas]